MSRKSIFTPFVDAFCIGGFSIVVLTPFIIFGGNLPGIQDSTSFQAKFYWGIILLNMPHFLASYWLLYRSKEMVLRYRWASIYIPLLMGGYCLFALAKYDETVVYVIVLNVVNGVYLSRHYTGQTWGMMATFSYLGGVPFSDAERKLIRGSLNILLLWHVSWYFFSIRSLGQISADLVYPMEMFYKSMTWLTLLSLALSTTGFFMVKRRTGRFPPAKVWIALISIYVWYAAMSRWPPVIILVQLAHALQYLIFPARVKANDLTSRGAGDSPRLELRLLLFGILLVAVSFYLYARFPAHLAGLVGALFGGPSEQALGMVVFAFISIHHYFTDGCIWKISNREVRKELFAHVASEAA